MGTKRYTPRSRTGKKWKMIRTFFFEPALAATSELLSTLFKPVLDEAESRVLEPEDVEDLFDRPTEQIQRRLDERQRWVDAIQRVSSFFLFSFFCPGVTGYGAPIFPVGSTQRWHKSSSEIGARYTLDRHQKAKEVAVSHNSARIEDLASARARAPPNHFAVMSALAGTSVDPIRELGRVASIINPLNHVACATFGLGLHIWRRALAFSKAVSSARSAARRLVKRPVKIDDSMNDDAAELARQLPWNLASL
ncbi:hypothetical protein MVLG_06319 [Microbotryum lychnidis-dioicae p1A1 Lamole]|uniref:Uncharacterized protein n=1 Tax=Microbotryum lychnidis-dioicae (strain p1A1 Lamole / MvSl-1064) TaxID=683840 RepID=U5HGX0_USTV1|nr:hypothetical protein MVLG_06319 [Microbotryum lychnidis-dioicae p1A1 Lamole]|eukprot:KDE03162.1 hypothetical protein MVLG_06319 [Microbotryum lychnidis-dioicae p1A1 Lamole]